MLENNTSNKRIAKNTILLYIRTILVMLVALYTSRVVLNTLGIEDYGVYQVVGGVVSMFAVISGALSTSISRFISYELGKADKVQLCKTFSTSIIVQLIIALVVLVLCEVVGVWFLENKLDIPDGRMEAATWVLHCSLATFVINLLSVPYNAAIIAHEKMDVFAYISILEVTLKLLIVFALVVSPFDKLISYAVLLVTIALLIRLIYGIYCNRQFEECKGKMTFDKTILKNMLSFAGWNFFSNGVYIFNNQGVTMLVNMFFGVALNAARGIATQVEHSVIQFTNNFTTAITPQIIKSFASKDNNRFYYLICKGSKFSFILLFCLSLPLMIETEFILKIWLKIVPDYAVLFIRLTFVASLISILGTTCYTACLATGNIKKYTIYASITGSLVFFLTWLVYELGGIVEFSYYIYIFDWILLLLVKMLFVERLTGLKPSRFLKETVGKLAIPVVLSVTIPLLISWLMPQSLVRFIIDIFACVLCSISSMYFFALTSGEKNVIKVKVKDNIQNCKRKLNKR